ncbi:MAG: molecular chaperone TorD family protein [Coriobacteriales bacterium]|jgi:TorA maturation chaperone TorD|nr:molecular chaperone TorD family protein [Coriobacteriales bacterium]
MTDDATTINTEDDRLSEDELQELTQLVEQRGSTYAFLSRLFRIEVDQALLDELRHLRFPARTGNRKVDDGYRLIATYLGNVWDNSLTELAIDYTRVFIGHGVDAFSAAYPFESVYTSEKRLLMQDARDEVLAIYRSAGLAKQPSWKEGEDHISLEMEYLQVLCQRTVDALNKKDEDAAYEQLVSQRNFLVDHLAAWVPMMTADMKRFAKTDLYQGLAYLTEGFLETDVEFLEDLLAEDQ